jgi:hypothetical protein
LLKIKVIIDIRIEKNNIDSIGGNIKIPPNKKSIDFTIAAVIDIIFHQKIILTIKLLNY